MGSTTVQNSNARTNDTRKVIMIITKNIPQTWNEAAEIVVSEMMLNANSCYIAGFTSTEERQEFILETFEKVVEQVFQNKTPQDEQSINFKWTAIAWSGLIGYANETKVSVDEAGMHLLKTVIGKQRMYGHGNISRFGVPGLVIRLNDKLERLKNIQKHDGPVLFEPLNDTWLDICGYSVIAIMWLNGWFMLELDAI